MKALAAVLLLAMAPAFTAAPTLAQQPPQRERGAWQKGGAGKQPPARVAEPARGDPRRPERMSPEDRERLRRDIDDANRRMERPGRR